VLNIRNGSYAYTLLELLSVAGEIPVSVLAVLGKTRTIKAIVKKMQTPQKVLHEGKVLMDHVRLLRISGKGELKTIRLTSKALPLLDLLGSTAREYYLEAFYGHKFPGTRSHVLRNHRVAEALALLMTVGVEIRQYSLPKLQKVKIAQVVQREPTFYTSRSVKDLEGAEMNKTMFTRFVGALFAADTVYAVYNTRDATMRWSGLGEFKTFHHITDLARMNSAVTGFDSAILIGHDAGVALRTLIDSDKTRRKEMRFDSIYHHIHYVPSSESGKNILRLLITPGWRETMQAAVFSDKMRIHGHAPIEADATSAGTYILCHLDCDIARLVRFRDAAVSMRGTQFEVICFPWQVAFLQGYLGKDIALKILDEEAIIQTLQSR